MRAFVDVGVEDESAMPSTTLGLVLEMSWTCLYVHGHAPRRRTCIETN
jgi:hypothetical protein